MFHFKTFGKCQDVRNVGTIFLKLGMFIGDCLDSWLKMKCVELEAECFQLSDD